MSMTEKDLKDLSACLETYEGNKQDFVNGVCWAAKRDDNPIVKRALELYLRQEEEALNKIEG